MFVFANTGRLASHLAPGPQMTHHEQAGKKGGEAGRNTGGAAPGREGSSGREQGALLSKLAWEPVQFYSLSCLLRLKYSLHCPTEF